ncbi:uncharacterized protein LOC143618649 [Bidens hawaiensis]|uniref:uncharacterized protein LOC143618649 n=1 Tax=Bidens hawaiensis TaxID=980011 RepID=UPI00404AB1FA
MHIIPTWAYPFISGISDVNLDGNCGFRAIALGLGMRQINWKEVRAHMRNEMDTNQTWWRHRFNYETTGNYDMVRDSLDYSTSALFQQKSSCESYYPMRQSPEPLSQIQVIVILNVKDNHWLSIQLEGNFLVPLPARQWEGYANEASREWKSLYEDRIKEYMQKKGSLASAN